jgi:hypothetical protein
MAIWELFSKREAKKRRAGQEDVFQYDDLPEAFRVQVIHIWGDVLGTWHDSRYGLGPSMHHPPNEWWRDVFAVITREKGVFQLVKTGDNPTIQCRQYMMTAPTEDALDLIELTFRFVDRVVREIEAYERQHYGVMGDPDDAIAELNGRFREHRIGYEYVSGEIIRVDSQYLHAEAVRPALQLLHGGGGSFAGPLEEFLEAHAKYRKGDYKDAIVWGCKAFESTLKAICAARSWAFDPQKDPASRLIEIVFANGLIPNWMQTQFAALRSVMESGVPTARNKTSGHGQGGTPTAVSEHLARYVLHLTASNIVFMIESHNALK